MYSITTQAQSDNLFNPRAIHKDLCFPSLWKAELNIMLHCIQILTNTREVTMQVQLDIGKTILYTLLIYYEYSACVESPHYLACTYNIPVNNKAVVVIEATKKNDVILHSCVPF